MTINLCIMQGGEPTCVNLSHRINLWVNNGERQSSRIAKREESNKNQPCKFCHQRSESLEILQGISSSMFCPNPGGKPVTSKTKQ